MAITGFSSLYDVTPFALNTDNSSMGPLGQYLTKKLNPDGGMSIDKRSSVSIGMVDSGSTGRYLSFQIPRSNLEYAGIIIPLEELMKGPVGSTLTVGYKTWVSAGRPYLRSGIITKNHGLMTPDQVLLPSVSGGGYHYIEIAIRKTSDTVFDTTVSRDGGDPGSPTLGNINSAITGGGRLFIGWSAPAYSGESYGTSDTDALWLSKFYMAYNEDGLVEFIGEPVFERQYQLVSDLGSMTGVPNNDKNKVSNEVYLNTLSIDRLMNNTTGDPAVWNVSQVGKVPVVSATEMKTVPAGQELKAVQVTSFTSNPSPSSRSASKMVVKSSTGEVLGSKVEDYLTQGYPCRVSSIVIPGDEVIGPTGWKLITEISADTK